MTWTKPPARQRQYDGEGAKPRTQALRIETTAKLCVPLPKRDYVRSPALLKACRMIPCQHCGASDGTVCAAHSNEAAHGKGRAIKASDDHVASLCSACHTELDQGSAMGRAGKQAMWRDAWRKTVALLVARKLWPAEVVVPTTEPA